MQVAADAFALGGGCEPPHLVLRQLQCRILLLVECLHVHDQPDDIGHGGDPDQALPRVLEQQCEAAEQEVQASELQQVLPPATASAHPQQHAAEHEVGQPGRVPRQQHQRHPDQAQGIARRVMAWRHHHLGVQQQEHRIAGHCKQQPAQGEAMAEQGRQEDPHRPQQVDRLAQGDFPRRSVSATAESGAGRSREASQVDGTGGSRRDDRRRSCQFGWLRAGATAGKMAPAQPAADHGTLGGTLQRASDGVVGSMSGTGSGTLPSCAAAVTFRSCRRQCHRVTAVTAVIAVPAFMLCRTLHRRNRRRPRFRPHPPERL